LLRGWGSKRDARAYHHFYIIEQVAVESEGAKISL